MDANQVLSQIGDTLRPDTMGDFLIYLIFIFSFITLSFLPDGNGRAQNLLFATILFCVMDLLFLTEALLDEGVRPIALFAFGAHMGMFVFPAIATGSIRSGKKKPGPSIMLCLLTAVFGCLYALMTVGGLYDTGLADMFFRSKLI